MKLIEVTFPDNRGLTLRTSTPAHIVAEQLLLGTLSLVTHGTSMAAW
jgi:hypothetical protein